MVVDGVLGCRLRWSAFGKGTGTIPYRNSSGLHQGGFRVNVAAGSYKVKA